MQSLHHVPLLATTGGRGIHDVILRLAGVDYLILGILLIFH